MDSQQTPPRPAPVPHRTAPAPSAARKAAKVAGIGLIVLLVLGGLVLLGLGTLVASFFWSLLHTGVCNPRC